MPLFPPIITKSVYHPGWEPGKYYLSENKQGSITSTAGIVSPNSLSYYPLWLPADVEIDRIMLNVSTNTANSSLRLGIFDNDNEGKPTKRVIDFGTLITSTTGYKELICSFQPQGKIYQLAINSSASPGIRGLTNAINTNHFIGVTTPNYSNEVYGRRQANVTFGEMPETAPVSNLTDVIYSPLIWYRIAP